MKLASSHPRAAEKSSSAASCLRPIAILAVAFFALLLPGVEALAALPSAQRNALIALYNSTGGPGWINNTGWGGPAGTECSTPWYGVECNAGRTEVLALNLQSNGLVGTLPIQIGDLANLVTLHLEDNQLSGELPAAIGSTSLQFFAAGGNRLAGSLPPSLWNLRGLYYLDLRNNQLSGPLSSQIGDLTKLQYLRLEGNRFEGPLPARLSTITTLKTLFLTRNSFSGPIPASLASLAALEELRLDQNDFSGEIPGALGFLLSLRVLEIGANSLTGSIPTELGNLSSLRQLSLGQCALSGSIPSSLGALSNLEVLSLGTNLLSGEIPSAVGSLTHLQEAYLDTNQLSGPVPSGFASLPSLRVLHLYQNRLSGSLPTSFPSSLHSLRLDGNRFEGDIPSALGSLAGLTELRLSSNALKGRIPAALLGLVSLTTADLRWNSLWTDDSALRALLDSVSVGESFAFTQTLAPTSISTVSVPPDGVLLRWAPPLYVAGAGGYLLEWSSSPAGPFATTPVVPDKSVPNAILSGLPPDSMVFIRMSAVSDPHSANQNSLTSEPSPPLESSTRSSGAGQVVLLFPSLGVTEGERRPASAVRVVGQEGEVSVAYRVASGSATESVDFEAASGRLTWPAGAAGLQSFDLVAIGDTQAEPPESSTLVIEDPSGGVTLGSPSSTEIEIRDRGLDGLNGEWVTGAGSLPAAAADPIGNRLVVWQGPGDGPSLGIFGSAFGPDGSPLGGPFLVNPPTLGLDESHPTVIPLGVERFLVAWEEELGGLKSRPVNIKIVVVELDEPFELAPPTDEAPVEPALASSGQGEVLATWRRGSQIVARSFTQAGVSITPERVVNDSTSPASGRPALAFSEASDSAMVSWPSVSGLDSNVTARPLRRDAIPTGGVLQLSSDPLGSQTNPVVVAAGSGRFLLGWQSEVQTALFPDQNGQSGTNIVGRFFSATGAADGPEFRLNSADSGTHFAPSASGLSDGSCALGWLNEGTGGPAQASLRVLSGCAAPSAAEVPILADEPASTTRSLSLSASREGGVTGVFERTSVVTGSGRVVGEIVGATSSPCVPSSNSLCLVDGRVRVQAFWRNQHSGGAQGRGQAVPHSQLTGYFWMFSPDVLEIAVKVLDGTSVNGHFWLFTASLSDVEYWLVLTDTFTGVSRFFHNPPQQLCGLADTAALPNLERAGARSAPARAVATEVLPTSPSASPALASGSCIESGSTLCMLDGRFAVSATWAPNDGEPQRPASVVRASLQSGFFWFFEPGMLEIGVKMIDARDFNGAFWIFFSSLSDREYHLAVEDTASGHRIHFTNPRGRYCGGVDFSAFLEAP